MATKKSSQSTAPHTELATLRQQLFELQMKKLSGELKETHKLKAVRKQIARTLTLQNTSTL
jgi:ribosomal protein L29